MKRALTASIGVPAAAARAAGSAGAAVVSASRQAASFRAMATFASEAEYLASLEPHSVLPAGFRVGTQSFTFRPRELPERTANMTLTLISLEKPTQSFAAMFTSNAFPGAPVIVGRKRVAASPALQAVVVNNKISNVCAPGGVEDSERLCAGAATALGLGSPDLVFPSSTGIIGWKLPVDDIVTAIPRAAASLQSASVLPAAKGICTTDLYPKVRSATLPGGARIVGIAKGAGMIEPGLATMLVYILTDASIGQAQLREALRAAVGPTFNSLSVDSDMSTSDTVLALASNAKPILAPGSASGSAGAAQAAFTEALTTVCAQLSEDIVRNGEGVAHVIRVKLTNAPSLALARAVGKSIVNSPLFKCAVAGNDPNVGRLVAAIGKCVGTMPEAPTLDMSRVTLTMGGRTIFAKGCFALDGDTEKALVAHLREAQLWESRPEVPASAAAGAAASAAPGAAYRFSAADVAFHTPVSYPPHEKCVEVGVDFGVTQGGVSTTILGSDLTHEYVAVNADYRS